MFVYLNTTASVHHVYIILISLTPSVTLSSVSQTPDTEGDWRRIARHFEERWQFPHCLGALDAKHIYIQASAKNACPSQNFIMMLAAVDADYKFIYTDVASQASECDAGVFVQSVLCKAMDQNLLHLPNPCLKPIKPCHTCSWGILRIR